MKTKVKPVYYCSTCKKKGLQKWRIEQHEKFCMGNPENVPACFHNCEYLIKEEKGWYCSILDTLVHTAKFEESRYFRQEQPESKLMPKTCDKFEKKSFDGLFKDLGL